MANIISHGNRGKSKFKPQIDITLPLSEWLEEQMMTTPNAVEDAEKLDYSYFAGRNIKCNNNF